MAVPPAAAMPAAAAAMPVAAAVPAAPATAVAAPPAADADRDGRSSPIRVAVVGGVGRVRRIVRGVRRIVRGGCVVVAAWNIRDGVLRGRCLRIGGGRRRRRLVRRRRMGCGARRGRDRHRLLRCGSGHGRIVVAAVWIVSVGSVVASGQRHGAGKCRRG
ncbi:hypothetical protein FAZ95_08215 [Trinickia violacea]|uniref:Uncharacterized protein n=1 Tax=Trinickia violacea TaxID=2571746 RepID=A0A4P8IQ31_9BURK|nr:hypothetical protein FAZ95_08215 [Trinickia violacea]